MQQHPRQIHYAVYFGSLCCSLVTFCSDSVTDYICTDFLSFLNVIQYYKVIHGVLSRDVASTSGHWVDFITVSISFQALN